jgi:hypothetical protein
MKAIDYKIRFETFIYHSPDGCWYWTGNSCRGYGYISVDGSNKIAHRIAYKIYVGEISNNLCVCHSCDNTLCVNPNHLFLGTMKDNVNDMLRKGRCGINVLKSEDVILIRDLLTSGLSQRKIAKRYNVDQSTISLIKTHKIWNHI